MTAGQLELPLFTAAGQCETFSNDQQCRYHAYHRGDHTFGGGMGDRIHLRRCGERAEHPAHAYDEFACSGRPYG